MNLDSILDLQKILFVSLKSKSAIKIMSPQDHTSDVAVDIHAYANKDRLTALADTSKSDLSAKLRHYIRFFKPISE